MTIPYETTSADIERYLTCPSLRTSVGSDWGPLIVRQRIEPPGRQHVQIPGIPDPWLVVTTGGPPRKIEVRDKGGWRSAMSGPGDIAVTSPGKLTEVRWNSPGNVPIETVHICMDAALFHQVGAEVANCDPRRIELVDGFSRKDELVEQIARALANELVFPRTAIRLFADSAARFLTIHLLRNYCAFPIPEAPVAPALSQRVVRQIRDYVEAHLSNELKLDELAAVAHISSFHFARLFKAATGETPHHFVTKLRIERAKTLLKNTDWPVSRIAGAVGFSSRSHFGAAFRRLAEAPPISFRNFYR